MDRLFVLDMPALENFEADGKIIEYICDKFHKYNCDKVERTDDLTTYDAKKYGCKVIPISSVEHTREWLKRVYNTNMVPIEIPEPLIKYTPGYQTMLGDVLLAMGYDKDEYFIKQIDKMKSWNSNMHPYENSIHPYIDRNAIYSISPLHDIIAEYRIFVYKGIIGCQQYTGSPLVFPDRSIICNMYAAYEQVPQPKAYTLDIAVTEIGTIPLEIHPFVACGLYGFQNLKLLDMWEAGLDWYIGGKNGIHKV